MNREETKQKIYEIVLAELQNQFGCGDTVEVGDREVCAEAVADALIKSWISDVEYERYVFKKAYIDFFTRFNYDKEFRNNFDNVTLGCQIGKFEDMIEQAEKELAEERKDEQKKRGRNDNADKGGVSVHIQERNAGRA